MSSRLCASIAVVAVLLALPAAFPAAGQVVVTGHLRSNNVEVGVDSVFFRTGTGGFMFETPGWILMPMEEDSFEFPLSGWPNAIEVYAGAAGMPWPPLRIDTPVQDSWYAFENQPPPPDGPEIKFTAPIAIEAPPRVAPRLGLTVAPTLVTGSAVIRAQVPVGAIARLEVLDAVGNRVSSFAPGSGEFEARWYGLNDSGYRLPEGIYFCRLSVNGRATVRKVLLTD